MTYRMASFREGGGSLVYILSLPIHCFSRPNLPIFDASLSVCIHVIHHCRRYSSCSAPMYLRPFFRSIWGLSPWALLHFEIRYAIFLNG